MDSQNTTEVLHFPRKLCHVKGAYYKVINVYVKSCKLSYLNHSQRHCDISSTVMAACTKWDKVSNGQMMTDDDDFLKKWYYSCLFLYLFFASSEPHRARLEELRMFLENETWELCPVKSNFNISQLHVSKSLPNFSALVLFAHSARRRSGIDISSSERIRLISKGAARVHCLLSSQKKIKWILLMLWIFWDFYIP